MTEWLTPEGIQTVPDESQVISWNEENAANDNSEANEMARDNNSTPVITVIGALPDGNKVTMAEWTGEKHVLSPRTLNALSTLGIDVRDNAENYLF